MTTIVSANDFNFHLIIPLKAASKEWGLLENFMTVYASGRDNGSERKNRVTAGQ